MSEEKIIREIAARARVEEPPQVDVADRVMAILRSREKERFPAEGPLAWVAACSSAAAASVGLLLYFSWDALTDPMMQIFYTFTWEIL